MHRCRLRLCRLCHHPLPDRGFSRARCRTWGYAFLPYRRECFRFVTLEHCRIVPDRTAVCSTASLRSVRFSHGSRILVTRVWVRCRILGHGMLCRTGNGMLRLGTHFRLRRFSPIRMRCTQRRSLRWDSSTCCGFFSCGRLSYGGLRGLRRHHSGLCRHRLPCHGRLRCGRWCRVQPRLLWSGIRLSGWFRVSVCLGRRFTFPAQTLFVCLIDPLPQCISGISFRYIELPGITKWLFLISRTVRLPSVAVLSTAVFYRKK